MVCLSKICLLIHKNQKQIIYITYNHAQPPFSGIFHSCKVCKVHLGPCQKSWQKKLHHRCSTINKQYSPLNRNQSVDLRSKSIDWSLFDGEHWSLMG